MKNKTWDTNLQCERFLFLFYEKKKKKKKSKTIITKLAVYAERRLELGQGRALGGTYKF